MDGFSPLSDEIDANTQNTMTGYVVTVDWRLIKKATLVRAAVEVSANRLRAYLSSYRILPA